MTGMTTSSERARVRRRRRDLARPTGQAPRPAPHRCRRQAPAPRRTFCRSSHATAGLAGRRSVRLPEPARAEMVVAEEVERTGKCCGRDAVTPQRSPRRPRQPVCAASQSVRRERRARLPFRPSPSAAMAIHSSSPAHRYAPCSAWRSDRSPCGLGGAPHCAASSGSAMRPQHRLDHRKIDPRHAAMLCALPQRGGDNERQHQPAHRIEPGEPDARRHIGMPVQSGKPGVALQQRAIGDGVQLRSGAPETRSRHIDQAGIALSQRGRPEPQPIHDAGREILYQHVAPFRQRSRDIHRLGQLQIEHDAALRLAEHRVQFRCAPGIAATGRLDLDHIGAHRRQVTRRRRSRDHPAEVQHSHARQWQRSARLHRRTLGLGYRQPEWRTRRLHGRGHRAPSHARIRDAQAAAIAAVPPVRAAENSARARPVRYRRSTACRARGSTPTSAHAAHPSWRRDPPWWRNADRCPSPASPSRRATTPIADPRAARSPRSRRAPAGCRRWRRCRRSRACASGSCRADPRRSARPSPSSPAPPRSRHRRPRPTYAAVPHAWRHMRRQARR